MSEDDDARTRWREGLTRTAARAYEAAHGNPLPDQRRGMRWGIEPRVAVTLGVVLAVIAMALWWGLRPTPVVELPAAASPSSAGYEHSVVVHVAGAVASPGVITMSGDSRVADAIAAAGGLMPHADHSAVNLARLIVDGEQIYVPVAGEGAADGRVSLNRADAAQLESLPGIGPVLAQKIIDYRDQHGSFASVADLSLVSGVGPSIIEQIEALVTV